MPTTAAPPSATPAVTASPVGATPTAGAIPSATPVASTPTPGAPAAATATAVQSLEPTGLPLDGGTQLGVAIGAVGQRRIEVSGGPTARGYTLQDQPSADPVVANRSGWNCRLHLEYEGSPAVDWYIQPGTPVRATMPGRATLYVITVSNAFDYYGVSREPYLGNPDRARAPLSPFPGPGGGKGVFMTVENASFVTEYAHLALPGTLDAVPAGAYVDGFSAATDYSTLFAAMRDFRAFTAVARWQVESGEIIGYSGDTGYSEAPHLHYTVRRAGSPALLCPTTESGFNDGGWAAR